jgi:hypothetical protein
MGGWIASGYEGDYTQISMPGDTTCGGDRAPGSPVGNCHTVIYTDAPPDASALKGWAGVVWQYPANNWGTSPGLAVPPGATAVTFYARGATGQEKVAFGVGGVGFGGVPTTAAPCLDTVSQSLPKATLSTTWTQYVISLDGQTYPGGVIGGFTWIGAAADGPADASAVTFYIDDIQWVASVPDAGVVDSGDGG